MKAAVLILSLFLSSCALKPTIADEARQQAQAGNHLEAVRIALSMRQYADKEIGKEAKEIIQANLPRAILQARALIANPPADDKKYLDSLYEIDALQRDLTIDRFITADFADTKALIADTRATVTAKLLGQMTASTSDPAAGLDLAAAYISMKLDENAAFHQALNGLVQQAVSDRNHALLGDKKELLAATCLPEALSVMVHAAEARSKGGPLAAGDKTFIAVASDIVNASKKSSQDLKDTALSALHAAFTTVAVFPLENATDEFVSIKDADSVQMQIDLIDDKDTFIKADFFKQAARGIQDANEGYYAHLKKNRSFNATVPAYALGIRIKTVKFNQEPVQRAPKAMRDNPSTMRALLQKDALQRAAYNNAYISHYEYTEVRESMNARIVFDYIIVDNKKKRIAYEDRIEEAYESTMVYAENPMVVGLTNKVPATYVPEQLYGLLNNKARPKSEKSIKEDLVQNGLKTIAAQVKKTLAGE